MAGSEDTDGWAFSEARDWLDRRHRRDTHLPQHAGEVSDREARRTMTAMRQAYERAARQGRLPDHAPSRVEDTDTWRDLRTGLGTETFAGAVQEGDSHRMRHFVGSQDDEPDISGLRTLEQIRDLVTQPAAMFYLWGDPGSGKTMFGCLLAEIWEYERAGPVEIASNVRTMEPATWVQSWPELEDWMKEPEEVVLAGEQTPKLYLLDEGSSVASGRGKSGYEASTKLAVLAYKIRKYGGSLVVIGHDGKDVTPAVRELCVAVHKTGKKAVQFFNDVKNREGRNPITPELQGVPLPDKAWQPNTYDTADFYWDDPDSAELKTGEAAKEVALYNVIKAKEEGLTNREAAKFVPYSRTWVGTRWNEYDVQGKHQDVVANVEELTT